VAGCFLEAATVGTSDVDLLPPSDRAGIGTPAFEAVDVVFEPEAVGRADIGLVEAD
jgi:hypothetical protein